MIHFRLRIAGFILWTLLLAGCGTREEVKLPPAEGPPPPPGMGKNKKIEYLKPPPVPPGYGQ